MFWSQPPVSPGSQHTCARQQLPTWALVYWADASLITNLWIIKTKLNSLLINMLKPTANVLKVCGCFSVQMHRRGMHKAELVGFRLGPTWFDPFNNHSRVMNLNRLVQVTAWYQTVKWLSIKVSACACVRGCGCVCVCFGCVLDAVYVLPLHCCTSV